MTTPRFLILPGWPEAAAAHWCARWQALLPGCEPVQQDDPWWPRRGDWMARLEEQVLADAPADVPADRPAGAGPRPVVLVAHHLGCHLVARWAGHSAHAQRVQAALLVAPVDIEQPDLQPQLQAWAPILRQPLPFASSVLPDGAQAPAAEVARLAGLSRAWGSGWDGAGSDAFAALQALCRRAGLPAI